MANEGTLLNRDGDIQYFTIADTAAVSKGAIMVLSADPRTCAAHSSAGQIPLGILVEEKIASDGQVKVSVRTRGIVDLTAENTITVGDLVCLSAVANKIISAPAGSLSLTGIRGILGRALETASADEVIAVLLTCG